MEHLQYMKIQDPKLENRISENENIIQHYISSHPNINSNRTIVTIPVVVHVVWHTTLQNISDAQVLSQIDVLNEDFSRTNADTINTPIIWQTIAANTQIQFCMAQRDPAGLPTNGIERRQTFNASFIDDDKVKYYALGGLDAWDVDRYLNIWVCDFGNTGLLGYGEFPTATHSNTYGVVIQYDSFGRTGTVTAPFDLGRTCTHEISHCFDLYHIWGDDGGACSGSDQVSDTPNQADASSGCYTFPHTDACTTTSPGIMFMNYMDYTDDNCLNMFTQGQAARMISAINSFYPSLLTSDGCLPVVLMVNDAGAPAIVAPTGNLYCDSIFTPIITIRNWGTDTLISTDIYYRIDTNVWQIFPWSGNLISLATTNVTIPAVNASSGAHTFSAYTANPNGLADGNDSNDTTNSSFYIIISGTPAPIFQGFETTIFPPVQWAINNPDGGTTWARNTTAHKTGVASVKMDNYSYSAPGQRDEIISTVIDLTTIVGPNLSFQVAYTYYDVPYITSDTLEVLVSSDCGTTFTSVYQKWGDNLRTATPTTSSFVPNNSQWRQENIALTTWANSHEVIIKFRNGNAYENNMYIDDININI